eukprot:jgi/Chrzof1/9299/UNPLg00267.t1
MHDHIAGTPPIMPCYTLDLAAPDHLTYGPIDRTDRALMAAAQDALAAIFIFTFNLTLAAADSNHPDKVRYPLGKPGLPLAVPIEGQHGTALPTALRSLLKRDAGSPQAHHEVCTKAAEWLRGGIKAAPGGDEPPLLAQQLHFNNSAQPVAMQQVQPSLQALQPQVLPQPRQQQRWRVLPQQHAIHQAPNLMQDLDNCLQFHHPLCCYWQWHAHVISSNERVNGCAYVSQAKWCCPGHLQSSAKTGSQDHDDAIPAAMVRA